MRTSRRLVVLATSTIIATTQLLSAAPVVAHPDCAQAHAEHGHTEEDHPDAQDMECLQSGEAYELGFELYDLQEGSPVGDAVASFTTSDNMTALGWSERNVPFSGTGSSLFNSDLAFQGALAFQGTYAGFRVIDVSDPSNPVQLHNETSCSTAGGQGDVVVYDDLLVRAWDAPVSSGNAATAGCGGQLAGQGFEGVHLFDISDPTNPVVIGKVRMSSGTGTSGPIIAGGSYTTGCGSHTLSLLPDVDRGNLYVYSSGSSSSCTGIDIIRIPIDDPTQAGLVRRSGALRQCHDTTIILGDVNTAACAGGNGWSMLDFDPDLDPMTVGGIANPTLRYSRPITGVSIGHSSAFSNDGSIVVFGHEPGGGGQAQCQAGSSTTNKSLYFYDTENGTLIDTMVVQRPQGSTENCTWHNFNIVPTNRAHVLVVGSYQMGITVIDFTDPENAEQIAFADPAPLSTSSLILGGDWSTYWYNGHIYESDIRRGLITWELDDRRVQGAKTVERSNPQTQTLVFHLDRTGPTVVNEMPSTVGVGSSVNAAFSCVDEGEETSGIWSCAGNPALGGALDTSTGGARTVAVRAEDGAANVTEETLTVEVVYDRFQGFYRPVGETNTIAAGAAVPVMFTLGGNWGTDVFAPGYPKQKVCGTADSTAVSTKQAEPFVFADGRYRYTWKTEKSWGNNCRELLVRFADNSGTIYRAQFTTRK